MKEILYHCSVKTIQRSKGRSATAAAAYRAAEEIVDEKTGLIHDYTRKSGVDYTKIIGWDGERSELWNAAELAEKRKDSTTAREYIVALPLDLENEEKIKLACAYGTWLNKRHGVAVDVAIHGIDSGNPHAHILTSTRVVENGEFGEKATREWADSKRKKHGLPGRKEDLLEARLAWEKFGNAVLEKAGINGRMDHRSHKERGLEELPQIHLGPKNNDRLKKGKSNERIEKFEAIQEANRNIEKLGKVNEKLEETPTRTFERFAERTGNRLDELEAKIQKDKIKEAEIKSKLEQAQERAEEAKTERKEIKEESKELLKQREELNPLQMLQTKKINRTLEAHESRFKMLCVELGRLGDKIIPKLQEGLNTLTERVKTMSEQFERINKSFEFAVNTLEQRGYYNEPEKQTEPTSIVTSDNDLSEANASLEKVLESVPDYTPSSGGPAPKF
jgi:hypothetical protein